MWECCQGWNEQLKCNKWCPPCVSTKTTPGSSQRIRKMSSFSYLDTDTLADVRLKGDQDTQKAFQGVQLITHHALTSVRSRYEVAKATVRPLFQGDFKDWTPPQGHGLTPRQQDSYVYSDNTHKQNSSGQPRIHGCPL